MSDVDQKSTFIRWEYYSQSRHTGLCFFTGPVMLKRQSFYSMLWSVMHRLRLSLTISLLGMWLSSLLFPAMGTVGEPLVRGIYVLLIGPLGFLAFQFGWIGNIFFLWGLSLLASSRTAARKCGWMAVGLIGTALSSAFFVTWPEGQKPAIIHGLGYYLWMACIIGLACLLWARALGTFDRISEETFFGKIKR